MSRRYSGLSLACVLILWAFRYFGRARELPGVKELFAKKGRSWVIGVSPSARHALLPVHLPTDPALFRRSFSSAPVGDEDAVRREIYKKYRNQGPAYYGDLDDADASLLVDDRELEEQGASLPFVLHL